ncbi:MAG: helix-turn-helix domain-containing protein [Micrococcales bacterium]|nr:helix-turn-helix domain-containing protein [Micrococcales bacterium]
MGDVGSVVRVARERAGMSMNELAHTAGTSVSTVSRIESGAFDPRWSTLEAVMSALGTTVDRERELERNAKLARFRNRLGNIFSAAQFAAPSYDPVELWTLLEGTTVGGKPLAEEIAARRAAASYDRTLAHALAAKPGTAQEAVETGTATVSAGACLADGIATAAALLALWTGRRLVIPAEAVATICSVEDAARYAKD